MPDVTLHRGDCLDVMGTLAPGSVDLVLCDLPYGTTACKWDSVIPFEPLWEQYRRVTKPNAAIVLTASQPFTTALISSNMGDFRYCFVWDKKTATGGQIAHLRPMKAHEDICVFSRSRPTYHPQMVDLTHNEVRRMRKHDFICKNAAVLGAGTNVSRGWFEGKQKFPTSVIRINGVTPASAEKKSGNHPTQKPVALLEYLIRTYTHEGETVLDNTMGSGSTGVACINTGRNFIGIERDPAYFAIAEDRIYNAQPQLIAAQ